MATDTTRPYSDAPNALPIGTRLGEFELRSLLGVGGFGIVYLAFDHALEREVAVKEYMPASLAGRTETMHVSLRSRSDEETFALGLRSFVNEAKLLARFDHPSLLKVHRFWEANGTAYMAMPVLRGRTLKETSAAMSSRPDEAWVRALLMPLLGAIETLHAEGVYHRDIAPDNIQIEPGGHPVLLDFGAARRVLSDKTQTLTAILKPAYAPIEQYAEAASVKQGPWTDLYALGATLHYLLLGHPPAPATTRAVHDEPTRLTTDNVPGCSAAFLRAIDWMLAPRPGDRPQSVAALRDVLEGRAELPAAGPSAAVRSPVPVSAPGAAVDDEATRVMPRGDDTKTMVMPRPAEAPADPPLHADAQDRTMALPRPGAGGAASPLSARPLPAAQPSGRGWLLGLGGAVAVAVVAAVALWPRAQPSATPPSPPSASASAPAEAPPVAQGPAAVVPAEPPAPAAASAPVPESAVATVVVGAAGNGAAAATAGPAAPRPPAATKPAANGAAAPTTPASRTAQAPARAPGPTSATPQAESPRTQPAEPAPLPAPAPAPTVTPAAEAAPVRVATTPEGICGGRNPLRYFVCMEKECLKKEFAEHPDCLKWRKDAKRD